MPQVFSILGSLVIFLLLFLQKNQKTMFKNLLAFLFFFSFSVFVQAQNRYIAENGNDTIGNDCTLPGNPCASISYAVSQAQDFDTIMVSSGNYAFAGTQLINKPVVVFGYDSIKPIISVVGQDVIQVSSDSVTINNLYIKMGLTGNSGLRGVVANGNYNGLTIENCDFISIKPIGFGMVFSAYAILAYGGNGQSINIINNTIQPLDSIYDSFGRGIGLGLNAANSYGPGATVDGNTVRAYYPIQAINNTNNVLANNNLFTGYLHVVYPIGTITVNFTNNTFDAYNDAIAENLIALLELRSFKTASAIVENNNFINYKNIGLFSSASRNILVKGNTFTPSPIANSFASIMANTKLMTNGVQTSNYSNQIEIKGNTFNAGVDSTGKAIVFGDHYGAYTPAFDTIMIGGFDATDKNIFDTQLEYFIALDTLSGPSNSQSFWGGYSVTNMVPFAQSVYALANQNEYTYTDTTELENKMLDSLDFSGVGKVILFDSLIVVKTPIADLLSVSVYPNPTQSNITIANNQFKGLYTMDIYDINGKLVKRKNQTIDGSNINISVSELSSGKYLIIMHNNKQVYKGSFIKN